MNQQLIDNASRLLETKVTSDYQKLHAQMVARSLKAYAQKFQVDTDLWWCTGLLHDIDYGGNYPINKHTLLSEKWLQDAGYQSELIQAVKAHNWKLTGVKPSSRLDYTLIACDEACGLLHAYSLMRPTGYKGMKTNSLTKKFRDKSFAAKIDRTEIIFGVKGLGIDLPDHFTFLISVFSV